MRHSLLLLGTLIVVAACAFPALAEIPSIFVGGDLDSALSAAKQKDTAVLVYIYLEVDTPVETTGEGRARMVPRAKADLCRKVEDQVLRSPAVLKALEPLVCVAIRVDQDTSIFARLGLDAAYPTFAWLGSDGVLLATFGACFSPQAYVDITARVLEMKRLLAQHNLDASARADVGRMFFDNGVANGAAEVLADLVTSGQADRATRIVYAFALRAQRHSAESLAALAPALNGLAARDATAQEASTVANGPAAGWVPVVFEKDGKFAGILYNIASAKALVDEIDSLEWALTTTPASTADKVRAARVFFRRENWPAAAEAYETAVAASGLSSVEAEECAARSGIAALVSGDDKAAVTRFDRYLKKDYKGVTRPDVCFYAGSLYLARSAEISGDEKDPKVTVKDKALYRRAAELLTEVQRSFPDSPFQPLADELLVRFFGGKPVERGKDGDHRDDRPPVGPNRGR